MKEEKGFGFVFSAREKAQVQERVRSSLQASWLAGDPPLSPRKLEFFGG